MGHDTVCVPVFPALRRLRQENHEFDCGQLGLHSETLSEATYMGLEYEYLSLSPALPRSQWRTSLISSFSKSGNQGKEAELHPQAGAARKKSWKPEWQTPRAQNASPSQRARRVWTSARGAWEET